MVPAWIEDDFFIRNPESDTRTMLKDTSQVKGCILLIERNVFHIINGFNTLLGMNGTKIAYGEDTELGYRAKSLGIDIWYDSSIAMYHRSHFMTVGEFLKKNYLAGQTHQSLRVKKREFSANVLMWLIFGFKIHVLLISSVIILTVKLNII